MPILEVGFLGTTGPLSAQDALAVWGATIWVDIGFDPAIVAQVTGTPTPPAAGAGIATSAPTPMLMQNVPALIDTGAGESCVDEDLAQQLQLPLINQVQTSGVHGPGQLNVYLAYIAIPTLGTTQAGSFVGARMTAGGQIHRALIGRSFLRDTLLVYDGRSGSAKIAR